MQVFDSAFLSSLHDLQHATMRLDPRDTFPSGQPLTPLMAYLFLVLHLRMNRYAERWLLFQYSDLRSKQRRKSAVRMYVRTWDSISFDAVEQTIRFLLRQIAEPSPPQSMQFSLLQSFARMLQASGCPFQQTFQVGACCFQVHEISTHAWVFPVNDLVKLYDPTRSTLFTAEPKRRCTVTTIHV